MERAFRGCLRFLYRLSRLSRIRHPCYELSMLPCYTSSSSTRTRGQVQPVRASLARMDRSFILKSVEEWKLSKGNLKLIYSCLNQNQQKNPFYVLFYTLFALTKKNISFLKPIIEYTLLYQDSPSFLAMLLYSRLCRA
jgi:hypothetical protein